MSGDAADPDTLCRIERQMGDSGPDVTISQLRQ